MSGMRSDRPQYQLMLSEVKKLRPAEVRLWKTDRLVSDRYELADAKRALRMAGCKPCYVVEPTARRVVRVGSDGDGHGRTGGVLQLPAFRKHTVQICSISVRSFYILIRLTSIILSPIMV